MEVKQLKKLFGSYTQFTKECKEYQYGFGKGNRRGSGSILFPVNGADCHTAKWLELFDPKTEDLSWIAEVFPSLEILEISENKYQKLNSLNGIENLKNLKSLILNSQVDIEKKISINKLGDSVEELYLWYTNIDFKILNPKMNFIYLHETQVSNFENLKNIQCNYLKLYKLNDLDGNSLGVNDFSGEFNEFTL